MIVSSLANIVPVRMCATRRRVYNEIVSNSICYKCMQTIVLGVLKCHVYVTYADEYLTAL